MLSCRSPAGWRTCRSAPPPDGLSDEDLIDIIDDVSHCRAYYQLLVKSLLLPGLQELAEGSAPTHLVICEKDRVLPHPRYTRHFTAHLPKDTQITHLDGVGHIPMFEAPRRVTDLIVDFVDRYATAAEQGHRLSVERLLEVGRDRVEELLAGLPRLICRRSAAPGPWSSDRPRPCR